MAGSSVNLVTQLKNKLSDDSVSVEEKLRISKGVFDVKGVHLPEDIIIEYLINLTNNDYQEPLSVFQCLRYCLSSPKLKEYSGNFRPKVVDSLIAALTNISKFQEDVITKACFCILYMLSSNYFQRWFTTDVSGLSKIVGSFLNEAKKEMRNESIEVLSLYLSIYRKSLLKEEMKTCFINNVYIPMCSAYAEVGDDEYNSFRMKVTSCISQVLLDSDFISKFSTEFKSKDKESDVHSFINIIKTIPSCKSTAIVSSAYQLFLLSSIQTKTMSDEQTFKLFSLLCEPLGLFVDKLRSISMSPVDKWERSSSYKVIGDLIKILDENKVPLAIDLGGYTLETWMISLAIGMTNTNLSQLIPELLVMLKNAYHFNPLIIEPSIKSITSIMLRKKDETVIPFYIDLIKVIIDGAKETQRLQKFIALFLATASQQLLTNNQDLILEDVFPDELSQHFLQATIYLPNSQVLATFKSFLYHIEKDCLQRLECGDTDISAINTEIISEMLTQLIFGAKVADHSVPDLIKSKFKSMLEDMQNILSKFGSILHDYLLRSYLKLCHTYGEIKMLFDEYEGCPIKQLTKADYSPTNLTYIHPYIVTENWKRIIDKILEHEDCIAKHALYKLLVQKIKAVAQVEEGSEGPGTQVARLLLDVANPHWLSSELSCLANLFQSKELVQLLKKLINKSDLSKWLQYVTSDIFQENRRLVLATVIRLLHKASKESSGKVSLKVIGCIKDDVLLEYELSQLLTDDIELQNEIEVMIAGMTEKFQDSLKNQTNNAEPPHNYIEVIAKLPLRHFSILSQSCLFISIVALLYDIKPSHSDELLFNKILSLFNTVNESSLKIFGNLNPGFLLEFFSVRATGFKEQELLMKKICNISFLTKYSAKQLIKQVAEPTPKTLWLTTMVISSLTKVKNKMKGENEKPLNKTKCISKLVKLALPVLENNEPSLEMLPNYCIILKYCLNSESRQDLEILLPNLDKYIDIAFSSKEKGLDLMKIILNNQSEFDDVFLKEFIKKSWEYIQNSEKPKTTVSHLLFQSASATDFKAMLLSISVLNETKIPGDFEIIDKLVTIWSHLVTATLGSDKIRLIQEFLLGLVQPILKLVNEWTNSPKTLEVIYTFFTDLAHSTSIEIKPVMLDTIFMALNKIPLPKNDKMQTLKNLNLSIDTIFALYLFRNSLILDRIPIFVQIFLSNLKDVAHCSHSNNEEVILRDALVCADKLERVAKTMAKRQKDYSRIAPYIIADIINIFEKEQLYTEVKTTYTNITNVFLSFCDSHAISYLESALAPTLFGTIFDNYKKFYRYTGKI